mmetsp:Transcript_2160/g.6415  ORF Transcript_2160/g.6415 Transcript_2160/m.6415 type:complete len:309 (+) Transcript_2160:100-1026(+)
MHSGTAQPRPSAWVSSGSSGAVAPAAPTATQHASRTSPAATTAATGERRSFLQLADGGRRRGTAAPPPHHQQRSPSPLHVPHAVPEVAHRRVLVPLQRQRRRQAQHRTLGPRERRPRHRLRRPRVRVAGTREGRPEVQRRVHHALLGLREVPLSAVAEDDRELGSMARLGLANRGQHVREGRCEGENVVVAIDKRRSAVPRDQRRQALRRAAEPEVGQEHGQRLPRVHAQVQRRHHRDLVLLQHVRRPQLEQQRHACVVRPPRQLGHAAEDERGALVLVGADEDRNALVVVAALHRCQNLLWEVLRLR